MTDKEDEAELVRIVAETAKERAAAQRLRAEITSVTASLESEKREIETALHIENDLMSPSVISDPSSAFFEEVADPDEATTARSLEMQLDATQKTLRETLELEKNLLRQIQSLRQRDAVDLEEHENEDSESTATRIVKELESSAIASRDSGFREHTSAIKWRERTLPNLILLSGDQERGKTPALLSGIVVERVFEGIVTFTSCLARTSHPASPSLKGKKPDEIHLRDVGQPENACATDLARVFSEYAALDIESANYSDRVRLVALKAALLDVQHLLNSHKTETELPRGTIVENPASGEKNSSEMSPLVASSDDTSSTQVGKADNNFLHEPTASLPSLSHSSRVMNQLNFARLLSAAPSRFHNCDLKRLYCTATDGTSLGTLYKKVAGVAPTILCVRDTNGGVFGCYAPSPWKDSSSRYYGTGETFVFQAVPAGVYVYKWTRTNHFFQLSSRAYLAVGGGGHFAMRIDDELQNGTTARCSTFDNPPLCLTSSDLEHHEGRQDDELNEFEIVALEAWTPVTTGHAL